MITPHLSSSPAAITNKRIKLLKVYRVKLYVRERSGRNDGERIGEYLAYTHLREGHPWCAAFVCWALGKAGIQNPRTPYSPGLFPDKKLIWIRRRPLKNEIQPGDVFGLYFPEMGRIAHAGFVDSLLGKTILTVEGNTNASGSREGEGVYRKRRLLSSVYKIARWD